MIEGSTHMPSERAFQRAINIGHIPPTHRDTGGYIPMEYQKPQDKMKRITMMPAGINMSHGGINMQI
jgi:hypothetical protein